MSDNLVRVKGLSKKFARDLKLSLRYGVEDVAYELLAKQNPDNQHLRNGEFWSLQNISFDLKRGECLGLIGRNGAGKSTLLKLINGLIKPNIGHIELRGRVGALIELGSGFNPILTGRENVYINGAILGLSKKKIDSIFDQIVAFSELEEFIDTPVQFYSSGMQVRLGFSIAINMEPDVLLIDEVLAVGDTSFKHKCYNAIYDLIGRSAVIFVSHSMSQVAKICNRGILLNRGQIVEKSQRIEKVIDSYFGAIEVESPVNFTRSGRAELVGLRIKSRNKYLLDFKHDGESLDKPSTIVNLRNNESLALEFDMRVDSDLSQVDIGFGFMDIESKSVAQCYSRNVGQAFDNKNGFIRVHCHISSLELSQGRFTFSFGIYTDNNQSAGMDILYVAKDLLDVQVSSDLVLVGGAPIQMSADWSQSDVNGD